MRRIRGRAGSFSTLEMLITGFKVVTWGLGLRRGNQGTAKREYLGTTGVMFGEKNEILSPEPLALNLKPIQEYNPGALELPVAASKA